jgi:hypothetical protein
MTDPKNVPSMPAAALRTAMSRDDPPPYEVHHDRDELPPYARCNTAAMFVGTGTAHPLHPIVRVPVGGRAAVSPQQLEAAELDPAVPPRVRRWTMASVANSLPNLKKVVVGGTQRARRLALPKWPAASVLDRDTAPAPHPPLRSRRCRSTWRMPTLVPEYCSYRSVLLPLLLIPE